MCAYLVTAILHNGVVGAPFHNIVLPHTNATALFHPKGATGKLNAVITPTRPMGFHCSNNICPGPVEANRMTI